MIELGVESKSLISMAILCMKLGYKWLICIKGKGELWETGRSWDHISVYLAASGNY